MTERELKDQVKSLVVSKAKSLEPFLKAFAQSRFMVSAAEYGENDEEKEALRKISEGFRCEVKSTGEGVSLEIDWDDNDRGDYLDVIEGGMDAPLTGGRGGYVTNPDGTVRPTNVPKPLWGNPIEEYAKSGSETLDEVKILLKELFRDNVQDIVHQSKGEIAQIARSMVVQQLRQALRK